MENPASESKDAARKATLSIFDPRRKGTDEDTLLKEHRPDLYAQKKNPSEKYRLARRLFEFRTSASLSQSQLAQKAGIGTATYQRIEECQPIANPRFDVVVKLAKALNVDVQALFSQLSVPGAADTFQGEKVQVALRSGAMPDSLRHTASPSLRRVKAE